MKNRGKNITLEESRISGNETYLAEGRKRLLKENIEIRISERMNKLRKRGNVEKQRDG